MGREREKEKEKDGAPLFFPSDVNDLAKSCVGNSLMCGESRFQRTKLKSA